MSDRFVKVRRFMVSRMLDHVKDVNANVRAVAIKVPSLSLRLSFRVPNQYDDVSLQCFSILAAHQRLSADLLCDGIVCNIADRLADQRVREGVTVERRERVPDCREERGSQVHGCLPAEQSVWT